MCMQPGVIEPSETKSVFTSPYSLPRFPSEMRIGGGLLNLVKCHGNDT